jgi:hypothetical protein
MGGLRAEKSVTLEVESFQGRIQGTDWAEMDAGRARRTAVRRPAGEPLIRKKRWNAAKAVTHGHCMVIVCMPITNCRAWRNVPAGGKQARRQAGATLLEEPAVDGLGRRKGGWRRTVRLGV